MIVPVLSKTIVVKCAIFSNAPPPLIKIPVFAPKPVPTIIAVGVARPKAQGQAITKTETLWTIASCQSCVRKPVASNVMSAIPKTTGTKILEILSAICWIGAFSPWASSTIRIIRERIVMLPTCVAVNWILPVVLTVPPKT